MILVFLSAIKLIVFPILHSVSIAIVFFYCSMYCCPFLIAPLLIVYLNKDSTLDSMQ